MYKINKLLAAKQEVFHTNDLALLWDIRNRNTLYTTIKRYVAKGTLIPIHKGLYARVTGCYLDWLGEMVIGDLNDSGANIIDIWQGPMKQMQEDHLAGDFPQLCKDCDGYAAAHKGALAYDVLIKNARMRALTIDQENYDQVVSEREDSRSKFDSEDALNKVINSALLD